MTTPAVTPIPAQGPPRLRWIHALLEAVALEVVRSAQELVDEQGAPPEVAAEMAAGFGRYLGGWLVDTAEMGAALYLATAS